MTSYSRAFSWIFLSSLAFSILTVFVKQLLVQFDHYEVVFFRSAVSSLFLVPVILRKGHALFPPGLSILVLRGLAGLAGVTLYFYSLQALPLAVASILIHCSPLFVIFYASVFLGEALSPRSLVWVVAAVVAVAVLLSPGEELSQTLSARAVGIGLLGAACAGLAYVSLRVAAPRFPASLIVLYFTTTATLGSGVLAIPSLIQRDLPQFEAWWTRILAIGLLATVAQMAMTRGYRYVPAAQASAMALMSVALSVIWGWLVFGEVLSIQQWAGLLGLAGALVGLALSARGS